MGGSVLEVLSILLLAAVLAGAVVRPWGWPEAVIAVPAAGVAVASGAVSWDAARAEMAQLGPAVAFLAAVLVLARLCDDEGLFAACGSWLATLTDRPPRPDPAHAGGPRPKPPHARRHPRFPRVRRTRAEAPRVRRARAEAPRVRRARAEAPGVRRARAEAPRVWRARAGVARGRGAGGGGGRRLMGGVFVVASLVTAVLSLDATVVLLTPVVFATARRLGARPKPHAYACTHLSNTASLLLPVSNLTNLLAVAATGLGFLRFAALMAPPWLVAIGVEYVVFRRFFGPDLDAPTAAPAIPAASGVPLFALVTVGYTLAGFAVASAVGVDPAWAAFAGALALAVRALARRETTPAAIVSAAGLPFLAFVLALGVVVRAVVDNGLSDALGHLVPSGGGLAGLLGIAVLAAVLANLINNLPAVLVLLPLTAPAGAGAVLAVLLGTNIGPNLTYAGSLATLLWRRVVHQHGRAVDLGEFTRLGLLTVPAALVLSVAALWLSLAAIGP